MRFPPMRAAFYLATSGAIVAGGATLVGSGLSQPATGAMLLGYLGLVALGVAHPASEIFADVVKRVPSGVAFTFDDGPHPEHTRRVLDLLDARGAKGTFFMVARKMAAHPDVAREVVARGHAVGAHSYAHDRLYALRGGAWLARDADAEEKVWREVLGEAPVLFRPPIGLVNPRIARLADERDRLVVAWSVRPRDGLPGTTPDDVVARVVPRLRDGAIVLLHDAPEGGDRVPPAVEALPRLLDAAARLGLSARTVPEAPA